MEFLVVSDTKLKITVTEQECSRYGIDRCDSEFSGSEVKNIIRELLQLAKDECGFDADGEKILVQMYPLPDRSCELFITKIANLPWRERKAVDSSDRLKTYETAVGVYCFSGLDTLIQAVRAVYRQGACADLYSASNGDYYIQLAECLSGGLSEYEVFREYGKKLDSLPITLMGEYGRCIAKGNAFDYVMSLK